MEGHRVEMLGTFQWFYNGKAIDKVPKGKLKLLFVYLLLHIDIPINRKEIAYLLWPESTDQQSQTNLRKLLHHFKKQIPEFENFLVLQNGQIMWKSEKDCYVDVVVFQKLANGKGVQDLTKAEALYRGKFLPGEHVDWVIQYREELFLKYNRLIQELVKLHQRRRDYNEAISYTNKILLYDPLAENIHQTIIRLHLLNGNQSAAIHQYHKIKRLYNDELGVQPSKETTELYSKLLKSDPGSSSLLDNRKNLFVGRFHEWERLQNCWKQLTVKKSCFVLIEGDKGIGKTHLLEQYFHWVAVQGATVYMSKCYPSKKDIPYESVIQWLDGVDLSTIADQYVTELARIIPSLLKDYADLPHPEKISDPWKLRYFFQAIEAALVHLSKPIVLLIDDLQWVDDETILFLEYLMRPERKVPLLIVATIRTEPQGISQSVQCFVSNPGGKAHLDHIQLGPLTEGDTKKLLEKLDVHHNGWDAKQVYEVSGGNPFFIQELFLNNDYGNKSEGSDASLRELMIRRLSSLPGDYRHLLEGMAILGSTATLPFLLHLSNLPEKKAQETVDFLYQLRLLKQSERGLVEFYHDAIREATLTMISPARKILLHAKIAEAMTLYEDHGMYSDAEIAFHFEQSGNLAQAATYYEKAVTKANIIYDHDQVINFSKKMLEILPDEDTCKPLAWLAHAYRMEGKLKLAESYCHKFLQQSSGSVPIEYAGKVQVQLALCLRHQGNYHEALAKLESAERQFEWVNDRNGLLEVYRQMTTTHIHIGQFEKAYHYLELCRSDKTDQKAECMYLGLKADLLYEQGMYAEAMDYYKQQINLANRVDARVPLLNALFGLSLTHLELDQYSRAFESIMECIRLTRSVRDKIGLGLAIGILGKIYLRAGWLQEAVSCLHYGLKQAQQSGDQRSTVIMMGLIGNAMHGLGYTEHGLLLLKQSEQMSAKLHFPLFHGNSLYYLGHAYCELAEWTKGESYLNKAMDLMVKDERRDLLCKIRILLMDCKLAKGEISVEKATEHLQILLSQYSLTKDQTLLYYKLWKLTKSDEVCTAASKYFREKYQNMPIPYYRDLIVDMKIDPGVRMMAAPPLPDEVSEMIETLNIVEWMESQKLVNKCNFTSILP